MNSKSVGERTEAFVLAACLRAGYPVLLPFGDNQRYDLVIERDGAFQRVQCKTGHLQNGAVRFDTCSNYSHRGRGRRNYRGQADLFGVYCLETMKTYLVPVVDVPKRQATLRVEPSRNGQAKRCRQAADYEL